MGKTYRKSIGLTEEEFIIINESREFFTRFTGIKKMSYGAYLSILALGSTAMGALSGVTIRCTYCGHETEMTLHKPKVIQTATHQSQKTE